MTEKSVWTIEEHEAGIVSWVTRDKRRRFAEFIHGNRKRQKLLADLYHKNPWKSGILELVPKEMQNSNGISDELKKRGGGDLCYCFCTETEYDGKVIEVRQVLDALMGTGAGVLLSVIPGKLGYYEAEDPGQRYIVSATTKSAGHLR